MNDTKIASVGEWRLFHQSVKAKWKVLTINILEIILQIGSVQPEKKSIKLAETDILHFVMIKYSAIYKILDAENKQLCSCNNGYFSIGCCSKRKEKIIYRIKFFTCCWNHYFLCILPLSLHFDTENRVNSQELLLKQHFTEHFGLSFTVHTYESQISLNTPDKIWKSAKAQ